MNETDKLVDQFFEALDQADKVIDSVPEDAWGNQSPCEDWTALQVVSHLTGTLTKVIELQSKDGTYGRQPAIPNESSDFSELLQRWCSARDMVRAGMGNADLDQQVMGKYGQMTRAESLALPAADLAIHSWDIAAATGIERELSGHLLQSVREQLGRVPDEALRRPGIIGPAVEAADGASETDQLMAFLGRRAP